MTPSTPRANDRIYFDHNATTPLSSRIREQVPQWLDLWGNPSSIHQSGRGPKAAMRVAREKVASIIGASPLEIVFTSGGSESNNMAIKGVFESLEAARKSDPNRTIGSRYVFSRVEHPSVVRTAEYLASRGASVEFVPVLRSGALDLEAYQAILAKGDVALVSVMLANNETGNVFPIKLMSELAHGKGALFHSDCVQALGKVPVDVRDLDVDLASFSGHKFYSLKGSGFLYQRRGLSLESLIHGGGQERYRRGGTENVLAIAALGSMCELKDEVQPRASEMMRLRDLMESRILNEITESVVTGGESPRLPNTSSLVIPGVDGETLLMNLDLKGFSVSTGAACSSGSPEPSPVLLAMGLTRAEAQSSLRVGIGWETTEEQVTKFVATLKDVVAHLRTFNVRETAAQVGEAHAFQ